VFDRVGARGGRLGSVYRHGAVACPWDRPDSLPAASGIPDTIDRLPASLNRLLAETDSQRCSGLKQEVFTTETERGPRRATEKGFGASRGMMSMGSFRLARPSKKDDFARGGRRGAAILLRFSVALRGPHSSSVLKSGLSTLHGAGHPPGRADTPPWRDFPLGEKCGDPLGTSRTVTRGAWFGHDQ
jgi:hypothetical protein